MQLSALLYLDPSEIDTTRLVHSQFQSFITSQRDRLPKYVLELRLLPHADEGVSELLFTLAGTTRTQALSIKNKAPEAEVMTRHARLLNPVCIASIACVNFDSAPTFYLLSKTPAGRMRVGCLDGGEPAWRCWVCTPGDAAQVQ